nr:hypothetical protein [Tanacetum cinerariifolium]
VRDFKSLAKEADESLSKHKALEYEIECLLRAVVSQDIMSVVQNYSVGETSNLQTKLELSNQKDIIRGMSANTKFVKQSILRIPPKVGKTYALSKPVTSNSIPTPQGSKVVKNDKVIAPGMFRINPFKPSREEKHVPNKVRASVRTNSITISQPPVITKKVVNSNSNGLSSTGVDNTKTRRPHPRSNTKNDRVPSASKSSCSKNKKVDVEEHHRKLLLFRKKKYMSSECNNVKLATQNVISKVVCAMCKQCLISVNHDVCLLNYVNDMTSRGKKQKSKVKKLKKVGSIERLASPKPSKPRSFLRWSPTGRLFDLKGKLITFSESDCSKGDNACTSNPLEPTIKQFPNFTFSLAGNLNMFMFLGTVRFGNDHVAAILGFGNLQWGNIFITKVYFVERLGHNLFLVGQFCDSDLESLQPKDKKIIETMNVTFDELSTMAFEQRSLKPGLQSMTSGQISSGLDLTYAPSTITTQQPTEGESNLLFEAMYDDYIGGQPSTTPRIVTAAQAHQIHQNPMTSTSIADTALTPTISSSHATKFSISSQDVDGLSSQQQHAQQQGYQAPVQPETVADNVPDAMFNANTFVNPFATPSTSAAKSSSSQYVDPSNMHTFYQPYPYEF